MSKCSDVDVLSLYPQGHQDEVFVLEAHPTDPRILLSAGAVHYLIIMPIFLKPMQNGPTMFYNVGSFIGTCSFTK